MVRTPLTRLAVVAGRCGWLIFMVAASSTQALGQCSFNPPLSFDSGLFPEFPSGYDANNYASEEAALAAAKLAVFGPSGTYETPTAQNVCRGRRLSMSLSMVRGGGTGDIRFYDSGTYPLANFAGRSILVFTNLRGVCVDGAMVKTVEEVYTEGNILTCSEARPLQLAVTGPSETRPAGTGGSSEVVLTAKVTDGTNPKASVPVSFSAEVTPRSGGHEHHDASRPKGTLSPTEGTTDANGEVRLTFKAPEVAGIHTIKATCGTCTNSPVAKEMQVKVPHLVEMLADTARPAIYTLVGVTGNHRSSHWFAPKARDTLVSVADAMFKTGWGTVGVNDGSLMWGGLFDIKGGWTPSHHEHRKGTEVDLSVTNPRNVTDEQKKQTYRELCRKDNAAFSVQTLWHLDDGYPEHFHMYLDGSGLTSQAGESNCCTRYKTTRTKLDKNGKPVLHKNGQPVQETVALCEETTPR